MADFMTFAELYAAVEEAVSQSGSKRDLVKSAINMVYLNEMLEADDLFPMFWMRRLDDSLAAKAPATITGITAASPPVVTAAAHGFTDGDLVSIYNVAGMIEVNNRTLIVDDAAANTFSLDTEDDVDVVGAGYTAYTSGGTAHHRGLKLATTGINVQRILKAAWHDEIRMETITPLQLEEQKKWWDDNTSRPLRWLQKKLYTAAGVETNQLWWFPCADQAYDLRLYVLTRATRLSADGDVPILPPQFHDTIVAGAITRLIESDVQVENAIVWPSIYKMQMSNLLDFNRKWYKENEPERQYPPYML